MIRSRRHLIPTNEKLTEKFSYDEIIPNTTKLPESVAPPQTANSPKPEREERERERERRERQRERERDRERQREISFRP